MTLDDQSDVYLAELLRIAADAIRQGDSDPLVMIEHVAESLDRRSTAATIGE